MAHFVRRGAAEAQPFPAGPRLAPVSRSHWCSHWRGPMATGSGRNGFDIEKSTLSISRRRRQIELW